MAYWAREYHLDGFRFDLMGLIDVDTMNAVRAALDESPTVGRAFLCMANRGRPALPRLCRAPCLPTRPDCRSLIIASGIFCDTTRDAIKGHVFFSDRPGYVNGGMHENAASVRDAVNAWRAANSRKVLRVK